jgi:hypothetical protein
LGVLREVSDDKRSFPIYRATLSAGPGCLANSASAACEFQLIRILTMRFAAEDLLSALFEATPRPTAQAPCDARGLYGLVDHHGDLRYIGSTSSTDQTFYERIHQRHRTGSDRRA